MHYKLIEGEAVPGVFADKEAKTAVKIFLKYKELMDLEFALPHVKEKAIDLGEGNWLICRTCDESWKDENVHIHEMVKCSKCKRLLLSPVK